MNKIIENVINIPCGSETIRFTACFVSMLMRAQGIIEEEQDFYCNDQNGPCIRCGKCGNLIPINRLHNEIYNLYTIVSGYGFLQIDLSDKGHMESNWDLASQAVLQEFDDYVGFTMDFAGYEYIGLNPAENKSKIFDSIRESINKDIPVLVQLKHQQQWVLITGYDDNSETLMGLDGSQSYWGKSPSNPDGYENGLFIMTDWYEKLACAYILDKPKLPSRNIRDVFKRGIKIMQLMQTEGYYKNSVDYVRNDANFMDLSDDKLMETRDRIAKWIGQPIDTRWMVGSAMNPLSKDSALDAKEVIMLHKVHKMCWSIHDVLWIAWSAIGEYKKGDRLDWAKGLNNRVIRNVVADCMDFVCKYDKMILNTLEATFKRGL